MRRPLSLMFAAVVAMPSVLAAQQVTTRANLNSALTTSSTEDLEQFSIGAGQADGDIGANPLNNGSNTTYGTGMVVPGIEFSTFSTLQVNAAGYFGMSSHTILGNGSSLSITFLQFTQAFGLDAMDFDCCVSSYSADIYDLSNALLGSLNYSGAGAPGFDFIGWQNPGGIGRVDLSATQNGWSPNVDNVTFGTTAVVATPEPASLTLLATGLFGLAGVVRRKRAAFIS
jgi:hypothetical protein